MNRHKLIPLAILLVLCIFLGNPTALTSQSILQDVDPLLTERNWVSPSLPDGFFLSDNMWKRYDAAGTTRFNATSALYHYSTKVGMTNHWNGTDYLPYIWDEANRHVYYTGYRLEFNDWYTVLRNASELTESVVDDMRWRVQYAFWDDEEQLWTWRTLDLYQHSFLPPILNEYNMTFGQSYTDGFSVMNVTYSFRNFHDVKIRIDFYAETERRYRFAWQNTGVDTDPIFLNTTSGDTVGVNFANGTDFEVRFLWSDVDQTEMDVWYEWIVASKKFNVYFGNRTVGAGETYIVDPSISPDVLLDSHDDCWERTGTTYTHRTTYDDNTMKSGTTTWYAQMAFVVDIPRGAEIISASLKGYHKGSGGGTATITVTRIVDATEDLGPLESDTTGTRPSSDSTPTDTEDYTTSAGFRTHDTNIDDMIQEQVYKVGWASGYSMGFRGTSSSSSVTTWWEDWENAGANEGELDVTYDVNSPPTNDGTPTIAVLDDTDNIYSRYRRYEVTTYHKDMNGFADIDFVTFSFFDDARSVNHFWGVFTQSSHSFEEAGTDGQKNNWQLTGSTYSEHDTFELDITWKFYVEWVCPDVVNLDLRVIVYDDAAESAVNWYETIWDIETDLEYDIVPTVTDDDADTVDRGDPNEAFHITGDVSYQGSALTPPSGDVDVMVAMTAGGYGSNVGPWEDDTLDAGGAFDVTCYADNEVGIETYTVKVVKEGTGYGGTDLIGGADPTDTYIADRVEIYSIVAPDDHVGAGTGTTIQYYFRYDYLDQAGVTGTFTTDTTNDALGYQSGNQWDATVNEAVGSYVFNGFTTCTESQHGLTGWTFTGSEETIVFDTVRALDIEVSDDRCDLGSNQWVQIQFDYESAAYGYVTSWSTYPTVTGPNGVITLDQDIGSGWWRGSTGTYSSVARFDYNSNTLNDYVDSDSVLSRTKGAYTEYTIWDEIEVYWGDATDHRVDIDTDPWATFRLRLKYDSHLLNDGTNDAVNINGSAAVWSVGGAYWRKSYPYSIVVSYDFLVTSASEYSYGITAFDTSSATTYFQNIIWDAVGVNIWVSDSRDNVDDTITVYAWLTYMYDMTNVTDGTVSLNGTGMSYSNQIWSLGRIQSTVGLWSYEITSISGNTHGITTIGSYYSYDGIYPKANLGDDDAVNYTISAGSSHTIAFWLNPYNVEATWDRDLGIFLGNATASGYDDHMTIQNYTGTVRLWWEDCTGTHKYIHLDTDYYFFRDNWYHVVVVFNSTGMYGYINGTYAASTTPMANDLHINHLFTGYGNRRLRGGLHDFRVYSNDLTKYQVASLYGGQHISADLEIWLSMNSYDYADETLYDLSGNGNDFGFYYDMSEYPDRMPAIDISNNVHVRPIWDRVRVVSYTIVTPADDNRNNIGTTYTIDIELHYDYDETDVVTGTVTVNGLSTSYQSLGKWRFTDSKATFQGVTYNNMQASGNTFGITVEDNTVTQLLIWDEIEVYSSWTSDARSNIDETEWPLYRLRLKYDNHELNDGTNDAVWINSLSASWAGGGDQAWYKYYSYSSVQTVNFLITSASEDTYGITAFDSASAATNDNDIIWDAIGISMWIDDARNDIDDTITIYAWLIYTYDMTNVTTGTILLNGTGMSYSDQIWSLGRSQSTVGLWAYNINSISGNTHGITVIGSHFFDGDGNDYVTIAASVEFDGIPEMTVSAWVYPILIEGDFRCIFGFTGAYHSRNWEFGIQDTTGAVYFHITNGTHSDGMAYGTVPLDTWSFISARYVEGELIAVSLNGVVLFSRVPTVDMTYLPYQLSLGSFSYGVYDWFNGYIDEVRLYNRSLSDVEIFELYQKRYANDTGLVFHMNMASLDVADGIWYDLTDNGHDGTIYGSTVNATVGSSCVRPIWDKIVIQTTVSDDAEDRLNINDNVEIRVTLWLAYDNTYLGFGDSVTLDDVAMTWDSGNSWWDLTRSKSSVGSWNYYVNSSSEATYGITFLDLNGKNIDVIWDRVLVTLIGADGVFFDLDAQATLTVTLEYEYDSAAITAGTFSLRYGSTYLTLTHDVSGNWTVSDSSSTPTTRTYNYVNGTASLYNIIVVNMNSKTVTVYWGRIILTVSINHHWTVIGYNTTMSATGVYEITGWIWNGTIATTNSSSGTRFPSESSVANHTISIESITDPDYGIMSFTSDDVWCIWDDAEISSVAYYWVQYSVDQVWLVWMSGTWTWEFNETTLDTGAEGYCKIQSYMNSTDDDWAIMDDTGQIGDLVIGSFNPSWYYVNLTMNCETTINGLSYDWQIWDQVLEVDILHSLQITNFNIEPTDDFFWITFQTNLMNASITIWDDAIDSGTLFADNIYYSGSEGMHQIPRSTIVSLHNLTFCITSTGTNYDKDFTVHDYVWWYNITYVVIEPPSYDCHIVILDNLYELVPFHTFEVYKNDTRIYHDIIQVVDGYAYNITVKNRFGDSVNSTIFSAGFEMVIFVNTYSFKFMNWYAGFLRVNVTRAGVTYSEIIMPMEIIEFNLYEATYVFSVDFLNGTTKFQQEITVTNSTGYVITGDSLTDVFNLVNSVYAMTNQINVTVTTTNNQVITISIDLINVNTTIWDQTINILTNIENSNTTIYDQTVTLISQLLNVNSTLYAQTVTILSDLSNVNTTLFDQTVTLLSNIENVNSTLYDQTVTLLSDISNVNTTLYSQTISILSSISNVNSTLLSQTVFILSNITNVNSTIYSQTVSILTYISNVNVSLYSQTVMLISNVQNMNSTIYTQTLTILSSITNMNTTIYSQTVTLMTTILNVNTTLYSQTVNIMTRLTNINATIYAQGVDVLTQIYNTNSTLYAQTVTMLLEIDDVEDLATSIKGLAETIKGEVADPPTPLSATDIFTMMMLVVLIFVFLIVVVWGLRALLRDRREGRVAASAQAEAEIDIEDPIEYQ